MTTPFTYSTSYMLDKSHFIETYDASASASNAKRTYIIAIFLAISGLVMLNFTEIDPYVAWFIIALGGLEVFSLRFKKSWWLARQLISKAANTELTLTIDDTGVSSKSIHIESTIPWAEISKIEPAPGHPSPGWLLYYKGHKNYLSGRCLSEQAQEFVNAQAALTNT